MRHRISPALVAITFAATVPLAPPARAQAVPARPCAPRHFALLAQGEVVPPSPAATPTPAPQEITRPHPAPTPTPALFPGTGNPPTLAPGGTNFQPIPPGPTPPPAAPHGKGAPATPSATPIPGEGLVPPAGYPAPPTEQPTTEEASVSPNPARQVHVKADYLENDRQTGEAVARGNVTVGYQGATITSDELRYSRKNKAITTTKPFTLIQTDETGKRDTVKGTGLDYNLDTQLAVVKDAFLTVPAPTPGQYVFISAGELKSFNKQRFEMKHGSLSTCNYLLEEKTPHYHTTSERMVLVPDDHVEGWNSWVYVNNRPIFWLPYFYIPLKKLRNDVTIGHNDIEGWYLRSSIGYTLNPWDYGSLYVNPSFRRLPEIGSLWPPGDQMGDPAYDGKGLGIGFDNVFQPASGSITTVTMYGLPKPDTDDQPLWGLNGLDPNDPRPFQDHFWRLRQQNLWWDTLKTDLLWEDKNLYDLSKAPVTVPSGTDIHSFLQTNSIRTNEGHNAEAVADSRWGLNWSFTRDYKEERTPTNPPPSTTTDHHGTVGGTYGPTTFSVDLHNNDATFPQAPALPTAAPAANPLFPGAIPVGVTPGTATATGSTHNNNWTDTVTVGEQINPALRLDIALNHKRIAMDNTLVTPATSSIDEEIDPPVTLTQDLGWGRAVTTYQRHLDFSPNAFDPTVLRSRGFINKLPEVAVTTNTLFPDVQPLTVNYTMGRYFEAAGFQAPGNPYFPTLDSALNRINAGISMNGKPSDLGLNTKLNFAGTSFQQYFYSTGDSQYLFTGKANLETDYTKNVVQSLTYTHTAADTRNNTPFVSLDRLSLSQTNRMDASFNVVYDPTFSWNNSTGYDYIQHTYLPLSTNVRWHPNGLVGVEAGTGYTFPTNEPFLDFANGQIQPLTATLQFRSTEGAFGGVFGQDKLVPGWSLNNQLSYSFQTHNFTQLQNTFSWAIGDRWQDHYEFQVMGYFDLTDQHYHPGYIGVYRDLHDFVLGINYNRQLQSFMLNLQLIAFGTNLVNLGSSSFGGTGGIGGLAGPGGLGGLFSGGGSGGFNGGGGF